MNKEKKEEVELVLTDDAGNVKRKYVLKAFEARIVAEARADGYQVQVVR